MTNKKIEWIYENWQQGDIKGEEALEMLATNLAAVEDSLVPLEQTKQTIRAYISEVVERAGGQAEIAGYGKFQIRSASVTKSYDSKALDQLIIDLTMDGELELAQRIGLCKKAGSRTGGLVILKEKETAK